MQTSASFPFQSTLSQGWTALTMLLLLMIALLSERGGFAEYGSPPGSVMLALLAASGTLKVSMSILVRLLDSPWFRWVNAGLMGAMTLMFIAHHLHSTVGGGTAAICGSATSGSFYLVETVHHLVGVPMSVLAFRWARRAGRDTQSLESRLSHG